MTTQNNTEVTYFNNSTTTACYINEIKRITPKKGDGFIAIKASMLDGSKDDMNYQSVDLIVRGKQAQEVIESFEAHWPNYNQDKETRSKVFANLRFASLGVKPYLNAQNQACAVISGRLIKIAYLKVNDTVVYQTASVNKEESSAVSDAAKAPVMEGELVQAPVGAQGGSFPLRTLL